MVLSTCGHSKVWNVADARAFSVSRNQEYAREINFNINFVLPCGNLRAWVIRQSMNSPLGLSVRVANGVDLFHERKT